jgi:hypothetical protein
LHSRQSTAPRRGILVKSDAGVALWISPRHARVVQRSALTGFAKPHVIAYRRAEKQKLVEAAQRPRAAKTEFADGSDNAVAAVRTALALERMNGEGQASPTARGAIATGGILIGLKSRAATKEAAPRLICSPALETEPAED